MSQHLIYIAVILSVFMGYFGATWIWFLALWCITAVICGWIDGANRN